MKETQYFTTSNEDLIQAAKLLSDGKTVIFPTETVYGLGANALDENAAEKIFSAKGRPSDNPLIVHISNMDLLGDLVAEVPDIAKKLMDKFWPGPLTLIFKKSDKVPKTVTGGLDTVAVRMPSHSTAKRLLEYAKIPIAAPSANLSGKPSPTIIEHVKEDMDGRVDGIIDGGDCQVGVESTVLDISCETPKLFRPGGVTAEEIEDVIGKKIDIVTSVKEGETPKSPGLKYKHYAPQTQVLILSGTFEERSVYAEKLSKTKKIGLLDFDDVPRICKSAVFSSLGNSKNPLDATHRLFAALRELDKKDIDIILAPEISDEGVWSAVKNRLYRAAGESIISLGAKKIVFVCTGNTCRSPMAEGILRDLAGDKVSVSSAGIAAGISTASKKSVDAMAEIGIDISGHTSKQLTPDMMAEADLILTMTKAHKMILVMSQPEFKEKIMTLSEWAETDEDVSDPYGGDLDKYRNCRDQIKGLIEKGWLMYD